MVSASQKGSSAEHSDLVNKILLALSASGRCTAWKNATGAAKIKNQYIKFGLPGSSDIIGILEPTGQFICAEVKTGHAKQTQAQINFQNMILRRGGRYKVCRSVDDALELIK